MSQARWAPPVRRLTIPLPHTCKRILRVRVTRVFERTECQARRRRQRPRQRATQRWQPRITRLPSSTTQRCVRGTVQHADAARHPEMLCDCAWMLLVWRRAWEGACNGRRSEHTIIISVAQRWIGARSLPACVRAHTHAFVMVTPPPVSTCACRQLRLIRVTTCSSATARPRT